jgi:small subunit ribosomal protein S17
MTSTRSNRRQLTGVVTSTKAAKTLTVEVVRTFKHAKYGKYVRRNKKYLVHDEEETAQMGDTVTIAASRPMSARKRWRFAGVVEHGKMITVDPKDVDGGDLGGDSSSGGAEGGEA